MGKFLMNSQFSSIFKYEESKVDKFTIIKRFNFFISENVHFTSIPT